MYDEIKDLGLELDFTTPATDKDIEEFENKLSITLGEQYKTFLKEFGTLEVEYLEFYGYFKDNKGLATGIAVTGFGMASAVASPLFTNLLIKYELPKVL